MVMDVAGDKAAHAVSEVGEASSTGEVCCGCCVGAPSGFLCFSAGIFPDFSQWFNECGDCVGFADGCLDECAVCCVSCCA